MVPGVANAVPTGDGGCRARVAQPLRDESTATQKLRRAPTLDARGGWYAAC